MEGVHDGDRVGDDFGGGGLVAGEPVHRDDLNGVGEVGGLGGQPRRQRARRASFDQVEQPRRAGLIVGWGQIDDQRDESRRAQASGRPAVLVDTDHPHPGQSIRPGCGDQLGERAHRNRADGVPGQAEFGGDRCDGGAVDHQPAQHIPSTPARRRRPWRGEFPEILIEHRTPTPRRQAAVARHGDLQHQRVAGDRQIGQRAGHGVAVTAVTAAVRTARIPGHRAAENRRLLLVDGSIGDRHAQLDGAHDRVGNNRRRAGSSLGQRVTSVVLVKQRVGA